MDLELELINLCQELGLIAEYNNAATYALAQKVKAQGKPLVDFTLGELLTLVRAYNED